MTAGRYVDRTRDDDAAFEEERARWEAAETAEEAWCDCILNDPGSPWEGHLHGEHDRERCPGRWTDEPPCGGCINCDMARAYYYAEASR